MLKKLLLSFSLLLPFLGFTQIIKKPIGCFAGSNGINTNVLSHTDVRGVLLIEKWADIEPTPGVYDFNKLNAKIDAVQAKGLKYALAIAGGAFGSPDWLTNTLNISYHDFEYQNQNWRLPLWWDSVCYQKLNQLITELGKQYASDSMLSHVYVTQMTVNGIEGHLNGVDMTDFTKDGFSSQKWIDQAYNTTLLFAQAFPDKPIVFEVHEIDKDTIVPSTIINNLYNDESLCNRIGLGMWWISGKTSYQSNLIDFIQKFKGDKYAQIIGRSDQENRFQDSMYSGVFTQAKQLGIRYIEPWPYEFQFKTHDSLMQDFNNWADANFSASDTCTFLNINENIKQNKNAIVAFPNPTNNSLKIQIEYPYQNLQFSLFNLNGLELLTTENQTDLDISQLASGTYIVRIHIDNRIIRKKIIKL